MPLLLLSRYGFFLKNKIRPDPGFVSLIRSDPIRSDPIQVWSVRSDPIRSGPIRSDPGFVNGPNTASFQVTLFVSLQFYIA